MKSHHRYLYGIKIKMQAKRIEEVFHRELMKIDLIHAHTLFSDGGSAYLLSIKYNIPYVLSVRATDINLFYKYALHYRKLAHRILIKAEKIIFISHAYCNYFLRILPLNIRTIICDKCIIIPNGISDIFFDRVHTHRNLKCIELITVASLNKNKNVSMLIDVVAMLKNRNASVSLKIVGHGPQLQQLQRRVENKGLNNNITFLGYASPHVLKTYLDASNLFVLVSLKETFGIAYIEAIARGLPIIYTENQGVDGYFEQGYVGFSVRPDRPNEICQAIEKVIDNYERISDQCFAVASLFSWARIGAVYTNLYSNSMESVADD
ncbi:glycosyltransferase [Pusillimonas sp. MFBS29]|uniref:glycosyltransferase n=1 Tax=Pusillimonas sp. MFBS29 TaxID=2886690 RepID=UPI001D0F75D3|nr:glycosyltransferase [Pusillimonas sp. MFBS29]MCC2597542.1 glycosyltransferase [Pusillimonas sp. MFBS29]